MIYFESNQSRLRANYFLVRAIAFSISKFHSIKEKLRIGAMNILLLFIFQIYRVVHKFWLSLKSVFDYY
jgi:hypothetical protein